MSAWDSMLASPAGGVYRRSSGRFSSEYRKPSFLMTRYLSEIICKKSTAIMRCKASSNTEKGVSIERGRELAWRLVGLQLRGLMHPACMLLASSTGRQPAPSVPCTATARRVGLSPDFNSEGAGRRTRESLSRPLAFLRVRRRVGKQPGASKVHSCRGH